MTRIMVPNGDGTTGWFDDERLREEFTETSVWDGNNWRGVCSGMQIKSAELLLTAEGRWVLHEDSSSEFNGPDSYRWLTDDEARVWLMKSGTGNRGPADEALEAVERLWPDVPEESGPSEGGRPAVGPAISVAYPEDLLQRIDAAAAKEETSRAAWLQTAAREKLAGSHRPCTAAEADEPGSGSGG
ncbi:hypothetical protein [Streptomyces sp. NRRL F-5053]|uniref:hypothetical protein n=1 Tax=Streptomyces sp. NRRL F-5053 TaxID=1463854 RepID=UPI0004C6FAC4|nr:hypothetical protein [Streptomyces sp. NRRL F-5053]